MTIQDYVLVILLLFSMFLSTLTENNQKTLLTTLGIAFVAFAVGSVIFSFCFN